jgi:hypothetical protein
MSSNAPSGQFKELEGQLMAGGKYSYDSRIYKKLKIRSPIKSNVLSIRLSDP